MRFLILCFTLSLTFIATPLLTGAAVDRSPVTFNKDVLPILQRSCQGCHRPGEAAPMSLLTYHEVQPRAKAIRDAVLQKRMPPWFADSSHGKFANDRSLSEADIATLVAWADGGAPEGDAADQPPPRPFIEGWNIGRPDVVFKMPKAFHVPASGTIEYQYIVVPTGFTEDRWVQMAEARPGNRKVVHHAGAFIREPGSQWLRWVKPGEPFEVRHLHAGRCATTRVVTGRQRVEEGVRDPEFLTSYVPGSIPMMLKPGQAKLIKAGSDLVFEMHYPDPTVEVRPGLQSWDEMMLCYMDAAFDASLNPELLFKQE